MVLANKDAIGDMGFFLMGDVGFWGAEHDFYISNAAKDKMILIKYRGVSTNTSETTAGSFFFEKLTKAG